MNPIFKSPLRIMALIALCALAGCAHTGPYSGAANGLGVEAFPAPSAVALDAREVIRLMRMGGFSDAAIVAVGPDLRNALARSGGARVIRGDSTLAAYAAGDGIVYVSTAAGASFIYRPGEDGAASGLDVAQSAK